MANFSYFSFIDLINSAVGESSDKEKRMALDQLHTFISTKKHKVTWNKSFESVMKRHLELCVDLKDHLTAKDGLHQYRNLCVHVRNLLSLILHMFLLIYE